MADIRIKDIARTASLRRGEMLETDHATSGSGKIDLGELLVIRNALSARQAIVFNGTAKSATTITTAKTLAFAFRADANSDILSFNQWSIGGNFRLSVQAGLLRFEPNSPYENVNVAPIAFGDWNHVTLVGVAGAPVLIYVNGLLTAQTSNNIINDLIGTALTLGADHSGVASLIGGILLIGVYNRALSAAEILTLYKNGSPTATDYNNASNTSLVTGNDSTFAGANNWASNTNAGGAATLNTSAGALHVTAMTSGLQSGAKLTPAVFAGVGKRYRIAFTIANTAGGDVQLGRIGGGNSLKAFGAVSVLSATGTATAGTGTADYQNYRFGNGSYVIEVLDLKDTNALQLVFGENTNTSGASGCTAFDLSAVTVCPVGLLCAPEPDAPGSGPQWRDASGNGVVINLPGDGASNGAEWALPSAQGGRFTATRASSGYLIADQVVIPANCRLVAIELTGNGTFTLGESAGTPANVIASMTATATSQRITPLVRTTSNRKLYAALGTATSLTLTPILEVVS